MNSKILIAIALVAMIAIAGCTAEDSRQQVEESSRDIEGSTGEDVSGVSVGGSYDYEIKMTEKNQIGLVKNQPPFIMENSLERANLIRRYQYLNDRNNVHHVYLMSNDGKVVSYFVAQGKVSSVNSKLTNNKQIVGSRECIDEVWNEEEGSCFKAVESPQMDGSYGTNGNAVFFFTTSGEYVEWNGKYVVSEKPLNIQTSISLEHETVQNNSD